MRIIDLSHTIEHQMTTYPGLPGPEIGTHLSFDESHALYDPGTEFSIGRIAMVANTGTYLDAPGHRYRDGHDLVGLDLARCANLSLIVIDGTGAINEETLTGAASLTGAAVVFRTGWDHHWGTTRYGDRDHPHLTASCAQELVERGAALVGIDSVNIDSTATGARPAHSILLRAGIPIVEHLTGLAALERHRWRFFAVPPAVRAMATFPVRAFAIETGTTE